jgi:hypothetical protein
LKKKNRILFPFFIIGFLTNSLHSDSVWEEKSSLFWEICTHGSKGIDCKAGEPQEMLWEQAQAECEAIKERGLSWRLPTLTELQNIVYKGKKVPSIDTKLFPQTQSKNYWANLDESGRYNYVNFYNGDSGNYASSKKKAFFRCVAESSQKINSKDLPFLKDLKAILPLNWYLDLDNSKITIQRAEKIWKYIDPKADSEALNDKKLKKIKKYGQQSNVKIVLGVEYPNKQNSDFSRNPDYIWKNYNIFTIEKEGIPDGIFTIYPQEAEFEIKNLLNAMENLYK